MTGTSPEENAQRGHSGFTGTKMLARKIKKEKKKNKENSQRLSLLPFALHFSLVLFLQGQTGAKVCSWETGNPLEAKLAMLWVPGTAIPISYLLGVNRSTIQARSKKAQG